MMRNRLIGLKRAGYALLIATLSGCNPLVRTGDLAPVEDRTGARVATAERFRAPAPVARSSQSSATVYARSTTGTRLGPKPLGTGETPRDSLQLARPDDREATLSPLSVSPPVTRASPPALPASRQQVSLPAAELPSNPAARALVRKGVKHQTAGRFNDAVASYERALEIDPDDAWVWHRLANVRAAQGQQRLALEMARRSNALGMKNPAVKRANEPYLRAL